ncbi:hypothetical protein CLOSTMETH_03683 [[Clostridium] methylpentosum DSM 5476]|uniref:Uncharacterized protein n=1 Tax=[Clostridium] methylpentosum DSM 5476 TaxID=537013 RepID=C0EII8_9FIRM|nr:hypothetical protein CLOSTMETH_03683 [[Clostridium] methylpentosum DSM 5476]
MAIEKAYKNKQPAPPHFLWWCGLFVLERLLSFGSAGEERKLQRKACRKKRMLCKAEEKAI